MLENLFIIYIIISAAHLCIAVARDWFWYKKQKEDKQLMIDYNQSLIAIDILLKQNNDLRFKLRDPNETK